MSRVKMRALHRLLSRPLCRYFSSKDGSQSGGATYHDPVKVLVDELKDVYAGRIVPEEPACPRETDMLILGGGVMGNAAAFWLKRRVPNAFTMVVLERDPTYTRASTMLSAGGIRHQFSQPINVQMSLFTTEFLRNIHEYLGIIDEELPDIQFNSQGYLFLAHERNVERLQDLVKMQKELGANVEILTKSRIREKFPWINTDDIECGSYGIEGEGWFDAWSLVQALKLKNQSLNVKYVKGEIIGFNQSEYRCFSPDGESVETHHRLDSANIKLESGEIETMLFSLTVNCGGPWASEIARMAGIGNTPNALITPGKEMLSVSLPVEPRKRYIYMVHCPDGPGLESPFLVDPTGTWCRREGVGGYYLCGNSPLPEHEPSTENLDVDYEYFNTHVWPYLAHRIPKFENLKVQSAWAGYYDYNTVDQNMIIGQHPYFANFFMMNGFSGHGLQHAIAAGRSLAEIILGDEQHTFDMSPFYFHRFLEDEPIYEEAIV